MKGLYVHIPFCLKKCKYCDFNSFPFRTEDKKRYLQALFSDMEQYKNEVCDTVFIGGGTPTSLDVSELKLLFDKIKETFVLSPDCEFTVEANPKTLDKDKLNIMRKGGVNRLSIGVQSFNDSELAALGRIHNADDAVKTVKMAKACGFNNISLDLMSAVPNQTMESFKKSIYTAISLEPKHISCYSLILEEGTPLYSEYLQNKLCLADEDTERNMYELACRELENAGFRQYEISNFAKDGARSRHNMKYWQCREYIGTGLSAHSYADGVRFSNTDSFETYLSGIFKSGECERLSEKDKMSEFMFMGLRMTEGISKKEFFDRFGKTIDDIYEKPLLKFIKMGMLKEENGRIFLSHSAISISNQVMCEFIL